jgi:peptide/nickel transport system substrate-binding protein
MGMAEASQDWRELVGHRLSRRTVLRGGLLGGAGLAAAALIGCGDDDDDDDDATATATQGAQATADTGGDGGDGDGGETAADEPAYVTQARVDGAPFPYNFAEPATTPKEGGILNVGVTWSIGSWDISKSSAGGSTAVPEATNSRLLGIVHGPPPADKFQIVLEPELPSEDGLTYTFHLEEGVTFQNVDPVNGRPFTSEDVKFVYERQGSEGANQAPFRLVDSIDTPDENTVTITLTQPSPDFLVALGTRVTSIYARELVDQELIDTTSIGTGPLIVDEVTEASVRLVNNPDFWGKKPFLDGMEFKVMQDTAARMAALRVGQLDFAYSLPGNPQQAAEILDTNPDCVITSDPILSSTSTIGFNLTLDKWKDDRVRQALALGMDRELMVDLLHDGAAKIVPAMAWPFVFDETPTAENGDFGRWWRFDQDEATKLLAAAGAEGFEFDVIQTPAYGATAVKEDEILQDLWGQIGVQMNINNIDYTEFNSQWLGVNYPDAADGWGTAPPSIDGFYFDQLHSESTFNRWFIDDPQIDEWAEAQSSELDPEARKEILRKIWDREVDHQWRLMTTTAFGWTGYQPWLRGTRWNFPYIGYHWFYRWGQNYPEIWLDK